MVRIEQFSKGLQKISKNANKEICITHISARVDTVYVENDEVKNKKRRQMYQLLKDSGLAAVFLGVESGSSSQLKRYNKGVSVAENEMAVAILRDIGLRVEAGFIMFDPLVTISELRENIDFIERTRLFDNDSKILGSLRIQEGSPYVALAKKKKLLRSKDANSLTFSSCFQCDDVAQIEFIFNECEKSTKKLIELLSRELRLESYYLDFMLLKNLVNYHLSGKCFTLAIKDYVSNGWLFLEKARKDIETSVFGSKNKHLAQEYLDYTASVYKEISTKYC